MASGLATGTQRPPLGKCGAGWAAARGSGEGERVKGVGWGEDMPEKCSMFLLVDAAQGGQLRKEKGKGGRV